jgi:osmotically inducible protein OsmC
MLKRTSEAQWEGPFADGKGRFWTESGEVSGVFSAGTRFEEQPGTNPEELIGAAHAGCFSMALTADLERAGYQPTSIRTVAVVDLDKGDAGWMITRIALDAQGLVPDIDEAEFRRIAEGAKTNCPISKALASVPIELQASLGS